MSNERTPPPEASEAARTQGELFLLSAPSGAGKTTLIRNLIDSLTDSGSMEFSVSHTTRRPRLGEVGGKDYHFVDKPTFQRMIAEDLFLEWAEVHGNYYGTSMAAVLPFLEQGIDVVVDLDVQGAERLMHRFPAAYSIFILPPSVEELERRLRGRGQDSADIIARRTAAALSEMRHVNEFDYVIINNKLSEAIEDLQTVVRAVRLSTASQLDRHHALFAFLEPDS